MKNFSPFQVILLAAFGAFGVAGILIFALFVGGGGGSGIGPITIWGPLNPSAFAAVIRQVAEDDSRLGQVTYVEKDSETYEEELLNALASGTGPDLFLLRQDYAMRDSGKVVAIPTSLLPEAQFKNVFVEAADPYFTPSGALAAPILADPLVMYWNKDVLATAGFAQAPKVWSELNDIAKAVVKKNESGSITKAAVAFGEYQNVNNAKDIIATLILQAGGSITSRDNTGRLVPSLSQRTGVGTSQAVESAIRFYTEFADPSKADYSWSRALPEARAAFAAGDLALYFGYASEAPLISRMNPNLNFSVAPVPQVQGAERAITAAHVWGLATTRTSKNPQGAITVATLLAAREVSAALSTALGIPSARRDLLSQPRLEGSEDLFNKQAIVAKSWTDPDPQKTDSIFRAMIEGVTSGALRITESIQRANQELAVILGQ
ncbi:MAG: extracellular solute-binding protein [Candidatus Kaiserbacteria bacterium]|nr:MAG: extracellular solute-binding protein [Candidatus Kaiserbacteria bacterium]